MGKESLFHGLLSRLRAVDIETSNLRPVGPVREGDKVLGTLNEQGRMIFIVREKIKIELDQLYQRNVWDDNTSSRCDHLRELFILVNDLFWDFIETSFDGMFKEEELLTLTEEWSIVAWEQKLDSVPRDYIFIMEKTSDVTEGGSLFKN